MQNLFKNTYFFWLAILLLWNACQTQAQNKIKPNAIHSVQTQPQLKVGAENYEQYISLLHQKNVGLVCNQGSVVRRLSGDYVHLVDTLTSQKVNLTTIFSPEHGFRGTADAGEKVKDEKLDSITIVSLYGKNLKPQQEQLHNIDILVFDLQDVGVRFYTYISTLHYVMEAAAEQNIPLIVLDRPNPNAHYIDGPVLEKKFTSFVGMHAIPVVFGMTIGEYAQMINGEKWLKNGIQTQITVIKNTNYNHQTPYQLPVKPSPNLPNANAIQLYPSLCWFEGTNVSCGRGTDLQFQCYGSPFLPAQHYKFSFTPQPNDGAKDPVHKGKLCYGENLAHAKSLNKINFKWLLSAYQNTKDKTQFFNDFFNKLAGNETLKRQIQQGMTEENIRKTWQKDLEKFKKIRSQYLLYP